MAEGAGNSKEEAERREAEEVKKIKEGEKEFRYYVNFEIIEYDECIIYYLLFDVILA